MMEKMDVAGGNFYMIEDMDVWQGLSNPYPLQTKISAKWQKVFENIYPITPKNEFLAVYLCILKIFRKNSVN